MSGNWDLMRRSENEISSMNSAAGFFGSIIDAMIVKGREERQLEAARVKSDYDTTLAKMNAEREMAIARAQAEGAAAEYRAETERQRIAVEAEVERERLIQKSKAFEKLVEASLQISTSKLERIENARAECNAFYEKQLAKTDELLSALLLKRDTSGLNDYAKLTPIINRLIENKEAFVAKYNSAMADMARMMAEVRMEMDGADRKLLGGGDN